MKKKMHRCGGYKYENAGGGGGTKKSIRAMWRRRALRKRVEDANGEKRRQTEERHVAKLQGRGGTNLK